MTEDPRDPQAPSGLSKRRKGERGRFVAPAEPPPPPPRAPVAAGSTAGTGRGSIQPAPSKIGEIITAIEEGDFQEDAFAAAGVMWDTAQLWLKLGAASCSLSAEDGRPLTWQGDLYQRVQKATALAISGPMRKLRKQANETGGKLAADFIKLRRGVGGGTRLGRDYEPPDHAAPRDRVNDEDMLRSLATSIEQAVEAARVRARERAAT